ncbi:phosphotransferase [Bacillus tamaricis]|uniref:Phosphotransferase n=2 Tax=Evansella tamaricis TaxID=2069301 RepID=A0ABS6J9W2_9BACI|nr:phosphotransferase [Evansella tamaricis]
MSSTSKKRDLTLLPNEVVVGRWHNNSYRIVRELGYGATGTVYLAEGRDGPVAIKIASDSMSITSEVNVLRQFSKVQRPSLGPSFYDADDYITPDGCYPFYAMEYIKGEAFLPFLRSRGGEWLGIMVVQLLGDLHRLHQEGWIFGDLKPENLLVTGNPSRVRWLDVGGITKEGRAIKEYTEFFDRGYWGFGGRKAEPTYDLFSVSMLMINRAYPSRFEKNLKHGSTSLQSRVNDKEILTPFSDVIHKGLEGKYKSAMDMRKELMEIIQNTTFTSTTEKKIKRKETRTSIKKQKVQDKKKNSAIKNKRERRFVGIFESMLFASFLLILYILYLFGQAV